MAKEVETSVQRWLDNVVVGLNLCPFAKQELVKNSVHFAVSQAVDEEQLLQDLQFEILNLNSDQTIETTLLILPFVLGRFDDYNQFLDLADQLLAELGFEGTFQIASFHPDYQFAGAEPEDAENYTNRSPYPILHLLREQSVELAIASYPNAEDIPQRNIAKMEEIGIAAIRALLTD